MYRCFSTVLCREGNVKRDAISLSSWKLELLLTVLQVATRSLNPQCLLHNDCRICFQLCRTRFHCNSGDVELCETLRLISCRKSSVPEWETLNVVSSLGYTDVCLVPCRLPWVHRRLWRPRTRNRCDRLIDARASAEALTHSNSCPSPQELRLMETFAQQSVSIDAAGRPVLIQNVKSSAL